MIGDPDIRPATDPDRTALAAVLTNAFMDDPVTVWTTPTDHHRRPVVRRFFDVILDIHIGEEMVYTDAERGGAAVWALPGHWRTTLSQDLRIARSFAHPRHWARAPIVGYGLNRLERLHPPEPEHFYLSSLGVSPERQGQGIGSRLIAPVLNICDRDGFPVYLESTKESNIAFYARHGFRVLREIRMPRGGPVVYPMWREPASAATAKASVPREAP